MTRYLWILIQSDRHDLIEAGFTPLYSVVHVPEKWTARQGKK